MEISPSFLKFHLLIPANSRTASRAAAVPLNQVAQPQIRDGCGVGKFERWANTQFPSPLPSPRKTVLACLKASAGRGSRLWRFGRFVYLRGLYSWVYSGFVATNVCPAWVRRYFCRRLLGFSGSVLSMSSALNSAFTARFSAPVTELS